MIDVEPFHPRSHQREQTLPPHLRNATCYADTSMYSDVTMSPHAAYLDITVVRSAPLRT